MSQLLFNDNSPPTTTPTSPVAPTGGVQYLFDKDVRPDVPPAEVFHHPVKQEVDLNLAGHQFDQHVINKRKVLVGQLADQVKTVPYKVSEHLWKPWESMKECTEGHLPSQYWNDCTCKEQADTPRYLASKNPHPSDYRVKTVHTDDVHVYYLDGRCDNIVSSTSLVHAFFPEFDTIEQAAKKLNTKTHQKNINRKSYDYRHCYTVQDIIDKWNLWRDLGTELHDCIERYLNKEPDALYTMSEDNKVPFQQFLTFWGDTVFRDWEDFRTEWAVFDEETRVAGKIDYVGRLPNGNVVILDWKRSKSITDCSFERFQNLPPAMGFGPCARLENCKYITYSLQLNLYKYILEKNYGVRVQKMFLVQMHPTLKAMPAIFPVCNLQRYIVEMLAVRKHVIQRMSQKCNQNTL